MVDQAESGTQVSYPQRRIEEIEFYNFIKRLLNKYNRSIIVFDIVDVFSNIGDVVPAIIKRLIQQVYIEDKSFVPSREEQVIAYKKLDYSFRKITELTGIHSNTQYSIMDRLRQDPTQIPTLAPKLDLEEYLTMSAFMKQIKKFKEV